MEKIRTVPLIKRIKLRPIVFNLIILLQFFAISSCMGQIIKNNKPPETTLAKVFSPRVLPDGQIYFRINGPKVNQLQINMGKTYDMQKDSMGFWSLKTDVKSPGLHFYTLLIDGISAIDPSTPTFFEGNKYVNGTEIPEQNVSFYDLKNVLHGCVRTEYYYSKLIERWRKLLVYTPPGYNKDSGKRYPTLYINHGAGEDESAWRFQGKLDLIIDNQLAEGKAVPMLIVMANEYIHDDIGDGYNTESTNSFFDQYGDELKNSIIPFIESRYRTLPGSEFRAIAGLSMGGGISFRLGIRNTDTFGWVGVFSTSLFKGSDGKIFDAEKQAPGILSDSDKYNKRLKLLYISSGEQDPSYQYTISSVQAFRNAGLKLEFHSFPGVHEWKVWRNALCDFTGRLFQQ